MKLELRNAALAIGIVASLATIGVIARADDSKGQTDSAPAADSSGFRCGKARKMELADFKKKLLAECNLNKPFSASYADNALDSTYFYCCHSK